VKKKTLNNSTLKGCTKSRAVKFGNKCGTTQPMPQPSLANINKSTMIIYDVGKGGKPT